MISPMPHIATMAPYALADLGKPGTVSMAQNESSFPVSPAALAAGQRALSNSLLYPDPDWTELRSAIAETHDLDPQRILCGAGSMELIGCLVHAYVGPGQALLSTQYGYAFVRTAAGQANAEQILAREVAMTVSVDEILASCRPGISVVFLCNPGNPTGTLIPNAEILRLRRALPQDVLLIVDQAYAEFCDVGQPPSEIFALIDLGNTVILRTFSKAYGLAGARVGWGYFPSEVAEQVRKLLNPNNVSIVSQAMAAAAMRDQAQLCEVVSNTAALRDGFAADMRGLGLNVPQSHTNFVLLQFDSVDAARRADAALQDGGLLMRGMGGYGLPNCLRATICAPEIMNRVRSVLKEVLS